MFLSQQLKNVIDKHSTISFDIFDTLLLRPYTKPTDLFKHLEKQENAQGFATERVMAEKRARKIHSDFEDVTIDEIYAEIADKYKKLKSKEMELERQVLQPNPEIKEVFDYAKKQKKQIIVISDMYLPEKFLLEVLSEKGYRGIKKVFVSCEYRKCKYTGNLYKQMLAETNINAKEVLHIGDNEFSDGKMAEKIGLSTFSYQKPIDKLFAENMRAKDFYQNNPDSLDTSILLGMLTLEKHEDNYWQDFGYKYAGPVILGYMQWLEKQLKKDKISEVMFVARDGYTLEKVFNLIKTSDFKTHYFYAPRSLNLAMNLNYKLNCELGEDQGLNGLKTLLHYYRDKDDFLRQNTPEIKTSAEGIKFIEDNRQLFEKLAQKEKKMYAKYFEQFGLKNKKIAIVDTCSTMLSAQKSLMMALPDKMIRGYYWFTWEGTQKDISAYKTATYQSSHKQEFVDWNIMELFMTAPTPPAKSMNNGQVIFKEPNAHEEKRIEIYPDLSQGAIDFAKRYCDVFGKYTNDFLCEILIDWVNILCNIPTQIDKEHFVDLFHAWDQEHTKWQPLPLPWFSTTDISYERKYVDRYYLFGLPLLKIKKTAHRWKAKLFQCIPLISYKNKENKKCFYLFGIPLFQQTTKRNKTKYSLFKIFPIFSVKRK